MIICGGISFQNAPVEMLEKVSFRQEIIPDALPCLRQALGVREVVLLSTCNRVEYFAVSDDPAGCASLWPKFLREFHGIQTDVSELAFCHEHQHGVDHLYQLASGLKSMVLGETEILGQIKSAYETAVKAGTTGKWLNRLFQTSFSAAKAVRSTTLITRGSVSVGSVSVELAEKIFGHLEGRSVMVIGAGDTSEKTARSLQSRGVSTLLVSNRTHEKACSLADQLGGRAIRWDTWQKEAEHVDIMISSTSAPHYVLTREALIPLLHARKGRPLFLIDLAVPRDFDPAINELDDVYLYDIDDLQTIAGTHLQERAAEVSRAVQILKPHVEKFCVWWDEQQERAAAADLRLPKEESA